MLPVGDLAIPPITTLALGSRNPPDLRFHLGHDGTWLLFTISEMTQRHNQEILLPTDE